MKRHQRSTLADDLEHKQRISRVQKGLATLLNSTLERQSLGFRTSRRRRPKSCVWKRRTRKVLTGAIAALEKVSEDSFLQSHVGSDICKVAMIMEQISDTTRSTLLFLVSSSPSWIRTTSVISSYRHVASTPSTPRPSENCTALCAGCSVCCATRFPETTVLASASVATSSESVTSVSVTTAISSIICPSLICLSIQFLLSGSFQIRCRIFLPLFQWAKQPSADHPPKRRSTPSVSNHQ